MSTRLPSDLSKRLFNMQVDRMQTYGLNRLDAMNVADQSHDALTVAYAEGITVGTGTAKVMAEAERLADEHAASRAGMETYDTARAVLTDFIVDLRKAIG